ncbi:MAG: Methyltransferase domain [Candidatus Parcubacteria bacterium]|jgi:SAM-dependent methyltransferase
MKGIAYFSGPLAGIGLMSSMLRHGKLDEAESVVETLRLLGVEDFVPNSKCKTIVDIGCGPGALTLTFAGLLKAKEVIAVDGSRDMLDFTEKLFHDFRMKYNFGCSLKTIISNLEHDPIAVESSIANAAFCMATTLYMKYLDNLISEVARILRPRGYLYIDAIVHELASTEPILNPIDDVECFFHSKKTIEYAMAENGFEILSVGVTEGVRLRQSTTSALLKDQKYVIRKK